MVYIICYKDDQLLWNREFDTEEQANEYIRCKENTIKYIGKVLKAVNPENIGQAIKEISGIMEFTEDDIENLVEITKKENYNKEYYDISEKDDMEINDIETQTIIFKTEQNKFIKGIVYRDGISTYKATEYDTLEECKKGGETREGISRNVYIEGGVVYIEY